MRKLLLLCIAMMGCATGAHLGPDAGEEPGDAEVPDAGPPDAGNPDAGAPAFHSGVLLFGEKMPLAGVRYLSGAAAGFTDDTGRFEYDGEVSFSIAGLELAAVPGAPVLTPFGLAGGCDASVRLRNLLVFVESVGSPIPPFAGELAGEKLAPMTAAEVAQALARLGKTPLAEQDALDRFIRVVDSEEWSESSRTTFGTANSAVRSQGAATDGASWFFSWRYGLQRSDLGYAVQLNNSAAIPLQLAVSGSDHIGDIDVLDGTIYAGIEDSKSYRHPRVGLFDAASLTFQRSFDLPVALQPDGVPWVAVDREKRVVYTSAWNPTPAINVWDLQLNFLRSIALSPPLARVQGAKPVGGMLYAAVDIDPKQVVKVNLATGTVLPLFVVEEAKELEGLAWLDGALHTLNSTPAGTAVEFRHHRRTRAPWRDQLCR